MQAATWPRAHANLEQLLVVHPASEPGDIRRHEVARVGDLADHLGAGDVVVVNDAATVPASLRGHLIDIDGAPVELRLASLLEDGHGGGMGTTWRVVVFGAGDWHQTTEDRAPPPALAVGAQIAFDAGLMARVVAVDVDHPRLITAAFYTRSGSLARLSVPGDDVGDDSDTVDATDATDATWQALYAAGRPVQYAYLKDALHLWDVQTVYGGRPWSVEMPSAGRPLRWPLLQALRRRGVTVVVLTHGAGLSSTGDAALDAALPLPERYEIPTATAAAIAEAQRRGGRVVAVGTSVVRALEGSYQAHGEVVGSAGITTLRIGPGFVPNVVDSLYTGMHELSSSHYQLLQAFAPAESLAAAYQTATSKGFLEHEFGDSALILNEPRRHRNDDTQGSHTVSTPPKPDPSSPSGASPGGAMPLVATA